MLAKLRKGVAPFGLVFGLGLLFALITRLGVVGLDAAGAFSYNYRAATAPYISTGSTLDQLCMALSGGTLIGFMTACGIALSLAVATVLVFAHVYPWKSGRCVAPMALVWGAACALVSFVCVGIVITGLFSGVQLHQISSKGGSGTGAILPLLFLCVATLIAAACCGLSTSLRDGEAGWVRRVLVAFVGCGLVLGVCTAGSFAAINSSPVSLPVAVGWLAGSLVANVGVMALFACRK
ncbi:hypothetical protein HLV38_00280 [Berryella wangjianweii]|uniref:Uncharacterized protein n=1 Tax=Berryella wangjianweii TaxID=2734634 RepID=A0A6M8J4U3_9ACTN|nr:hypothetical protein [Berryella wangjianweii]QKF06728.1 hypothetical protein HLV38_00280 [Berryella wangjianweii]